jgi:hypothetical protein
MIRLTLQTILAPAILLLSGSLVEIQASDTKVTLKDGGSILLHVDGLESAKDWTVKPSELRHMNRKGVLSGLQITEAGEDRCADDPKCGIDPAVKWTIQVVYGEDSLTIAPVIGNKGLHVRFPRNLPFDKWERTEKTDERQFGHGDGKHIVSIKVNNGDSLCAGHGCEIVLTFSPR